MKKLLSDSVIYLGTNFLSKAVGFLLIPVLTNINYVSEEGYGQIILFSSFSLLLNPFIAFGGLDLIGIQYFDRNIDHDVLIRRCNTNSFFIFLFTTAFLLLFSPVLIHSFGIPLFVLLILPLSSLLNYYTEVLLLLLRFKSNAKGYFKTFVIKTILDAGVTLFCVLVLRWGWYSRLAGFFCGYLFILFVMIRVISVRNLLAPFSRPEFKKFVIRATPFVLLQFFIIGLTNMDKIMIPQAFEKRDLALYGLAFQLGYLLPTVSSALTTMTQPVIYRLLSDYNEAARRKLQKIVFGSFGVILVAAIGIYLCMPLFYSHFINNPRYREGAYLVKYMLLAWTFWCCASILIDIIKKTGSRKQIVSSYFIPFLVLTGCLYFAGKYFGLVGITWSLILSYGLVFLLLIYYTRKQLSLLQAVNKNNHP